MIVKNKIIPLVFILFFFIQFYNVYEHSIYLQFLLMLIGLISFLFVYKDISRNGYFLLVTLLIFSIITTILSQKLKFGDIIYSVAMPVFGYLIIAYKDKLITPAIIYCMSVILYCSYHIYSGSNLNTEIFLSSSRNYISVLAIFSYYVVFISSNNNLLKTILFIGVAIIIIFSNSRSGLISLVILLSGIALNYFLSMKSSKTILLLILPFIFILIFISTQSSLLSDIFLTIKRLQVAGLSDPGRQAVITCYMDNMNVQSFLFGIDFNNHNCSFLANNHDNPHNSFIRLYGNLGLGFYIILYLLIMSFLNLIKSRNIILAFFLLTFIFRGSTDIIFFFQSWDAYIFSLIIFANQHLFLNKRLKVNENVSNFDGNNA